MSSHENNLNYNHIITPHRNETHEEHGHHEKGHEPHEEVVSNLCEMPDVIVGVLHELDDQGNHAARSRGEVQEACYPHLLPSTYQH